MTLERSDSKNHPRALEVRFHAARMGFGGEALFETLDMFLPAGFITCLLGPSGVGKSTLLRLLAGLVPLSRADRLVCDDGKPLDGRVAYMDQRDLLFPWLRVIDNVMLGSRLRGERPDRSRAVDLLRRVGLQGAEFLRPGQLSGGMRQRAALARTLMEDRPVVLMDEPFSAVDAITRFRLQGLAARLLAGRTVLLITHDPNEALRLGHRIHVLSGRPAQLDNPLEPPGEPPRDPAAVALHGLYATIMGRLGVGLDA